MEGGGDQSSAADVFAPTLPPHSAEAVGPVVVDGASLDVAVVSVADVASTSLPRTAAIAAQVQWGAPPLSSSSAYPSSSQPKNRVGGGSVASAASDGNAGDDEDDDDEDDDEEEGGGQRRRRRRRGGSQPPAYDCYGRELDDDPPSSCAVALCPCGATNGNTRRLCRLTSSASTFPFTCVIGPDWPCLCITYGLIFGPTLAFLALVAPKVHVAVLVLSILTLLVLVLALATTAGTDPGYVRKQTRRQLEEQQIRIVREAEAVEGAGPGAGQAALSQYSTCARCRVLRAAGTHHCYDCDVCVEELDHHCPWTGKCIGE
jgi:hypothetical protein